MREYKLFQGKTLAILSGGGDTPAINSSIENIRNRAQLLGYKVYGIRHGWKGLLGDGDIVDLTNQPYDGIYGGTALRSSRTNPFPSKKNPESRVPQVLKNIERYKSRSEVEQPIILSMFSGEIHNQFELFFLQKNILLQALWLM